MRPFRIYDKSEGKFLDGDSWCINREGELGAFDYSLEFRIEGNRYEASFQLPKQDVNGDHIYTGDLVKRIHDKSAELEREFAEDHDEIEDVEAYVNDRSGAIGLVVWTGMEFRIELLEGHKWAFYGPEGGLSFYSWNDDIEIVGNKWNTDLTQYEYYVRD
jgi:hypothetical protein